MSQWTRPTRPLLCLLLALLLCGALVSCGDEKFGEAERAEVHRVLQTGVDLSSDPYVQAETLRVLELIGKPTLNHFAQQVVSTTASPMARVAALRVLMANDGKDVRRLAVAQFNRADERERKVILEAVYEYGSASLRRMLIERALASRDPALRREAFERGPLERLHQAQEQQKTTFLKHTLFPEIGQFVGDSDPVIAAMALRALIDAGEPERAQPLLDVLADPARPRAERLTAARVLGAAEVKRAIPFYQKILESVRIEDSGELIVPERIDREMVRVATLGMVACGDAELLLPAQFYLEKADVQDTIEVLTALGTNPADDAAVNLKVAMMDVRPVVRNEAIRLYLKHPRANAADLIEVMGRSDFDVKERLARHLAEHFPREWARHLSTKLADAASSLETLEFLRGVLLSEAQNQVLKHLEQPLTALTSGEHKQAAALAALLLVKISDDPRPHQLLMGVELPEIRYAYLEFLVRTAPRQNVEFFRKNLYGDLYAIRLMSAAGMLLAFDAGAPARDPDGDDPASAAGAGKDGL